MNALGWVRFSLSLAPVVNTMLRDLYALTRGDVRLSKEAITRIRDRGYLLDEARREVDARLDALDKPGGA